MRDRDGFSLIEVIIVLAVIAIVVTVATTNFQLWLNHSSGVGFQREFLSLFSEARTRSMASSLQHRLLIDQGTETVTLQRGDSGTGSTIWGPPAAQVTTQVRGTRGAGISDVVYDNAITLPTNFAFVFNPDGEVLVQTDPGSAATITPLTQANVHLSASTEADRATIRVFGWTSKARLLHGWL